MPAFRMQHDTELKEGKQKTKLNSQANWNIHFEPAASRMLYFPRSPTLAVVAQTSTIMDPLLPLEAIVAIYSDLI